MFKMLTTIFLMTLVASLSLQDCPKERTNKGISVVWRQSKPANNVTSDPLCYFKKQLVTRNCTEFGWTPALNELQPCFQVIEDFDVSSCPPGYLQVSIDNNKYCYQISNEAPWSYPCLTSGGASVITDLTDDEFKSLLSSLKNFSSRNFYWLPAHRRKSFTPLVWSIPGPNWRQVVDREDLQVFPSLLKNCLMLDVEKQTLVTEACNRILPSLCLYLNDFDYPSHCPDGYYSFRFMSDDGICFGIERAEESNGITFEEFVNDKCRKPMGDNKFNDFTRFLFLKLAEIAYLPENEWCWFKTLIISKEVDHYSQDENNNNTTNSLVNRPFLHGIINKNGTEMVMDALSTLPCMACEMQIKYSGEPELKLEFIPEELSLYLTVYFPSGLWKYANDDIGVNCFSDAKGFVKPVDIEDMPFIQISATLNEENNTNVEKSVYAVGLVTNRSAQYWCEAHNKSFSLLTSNKVIAASKTNLLHVFALVVKLSTYDNESFPDLTDIVNNISQVFQAQKVLLMDILEYTSEQMVILTHLHVNTVDDFEDDTKNLQATYEALKDKAEKEFCSSCRMIFVNISSSLYCLPSVTYTNKILKWDLTKIGEVAAPSQFCLQSNGLPVRRQCLGSYLLGGQWGDVEGQCNETYEPSLKTTFLYNFVKGLIPENNTSRFLIDGLEFVLDDVDIIIPADIYYLSVSFQHVLEMAHINESSVEMGDLEHMAWAVDRIMLMDVNYLRLAQTFNSTNVILDSVNNVIVTLARTNDTTNEKSSNHIYQLSIKPQFVVQISYPLFNNITGLAVARKYANVSETFSDMSVIPLYANSSLKDIVEIENLEIATWVPDIVLANLRKNGNSSDDFVNSEDVHVVVSVYHNDAIFQQLDPSIHTINSRVIGLAIPGCKTNLLHSIPLLFKELNTNYSKKICGFWDFDTKRRGTNPGFWSDRGCFFQKSINNITVCRCSHMTNFGQLLDISEISKPRRPRHPCHAKALNVITLIGSTLSLIGIAGIWITAIVFQTWRKKPGTKVLLQLSTAIGMPLVFMIVFNLDNTIFYKQGGKHIVRDNKRIICIILGCLLQYSILASFSWMLITAVLQFVRYVRVLGVCRPSRFLFKFAVVGWGIPLIPVAVILAVDYQNYIPDPSTEPEKRICYPKGTHLILGVVMPIILVLIVNVVLFGFVLCSISRGPEGKMKTSDMDLIKTQLRLSLFLFFLLGLTWIFGIFSFLNNTMLWSYLFCLTSTLQGFVLFVYFVICDPATRNLWITLMKPQFQVTSSRKSVSSISSG